MSARDAGAHMGPSKRERRSLAWWASDWAWGACDALSVVAQAITRRAADQSRRERIAREQSDALSLGDWLALSDDDMGAWLDAIADDESSAS